MRSPRYGRTSRYPNRAGRLSGSAARNAPQEEQRNRLVGPPRHPLAAPSSGRPPILVLQLGRDSLPWWSSARCPPPTDRDTEPARRTRIEPRLRSGVGPQPFLAGRHLPEWEVFDIVDKNLPRDTIRAGDWPAPIPDHLRALAAEAGLRANRAFQVDLTYDHEKPILERMPPAGPDAIRER